MVYFKRLSVCPLPFIGYVTARSRSEPLPSRSKIERNKLYQDYCVFVQVQQLASSVYHFLMEISGQSSQFIEWLGESLSLRN